MSTKYTRKQSSAPLVLHAMQFKSLDSYFDIVKWMKECGDTHALAGEVRFETPLMLIHTSKGLDCAHYGDYIVCGEDYNFFVLSKEFFEDNYDKDPS